MVMISRNRNGWMINLRGCDHQRCGPQCSCGALPHGWCRRNGCACSTTSSWAQTSLPASSPGQPRIGLAWPIAKIPFWGIPGKKVACNCGLLELWATFGIFWGIVACGFPGKGSNETPLILQFSPAPATIQATLQL